VSVQVISSTVGAHRGLSAGAFIIADFEDASAVGYQETACQGQFVDGREDVKPLPIAGIRSYGRHSLGGLAGAT
jgi:hypothetical protein